MNGGVCPLCAAACVSFFARDNFREYLRCADCRLIFVPPRYHLSRSEEKAQYDLHENSPDDQGYRRFLSRVFEPVCDRLTAGSKGLDFGSGPGPTLSVMFEEVGYRMALYDTFYAPDQTVLSDRYDFVTATEVVEHFRKPKEDLARLFSCVKPGGLLGVMTKLATDREAFESWHYKNDPTHLSFFSRETFEWLANEWNTDLTFSGSDVILMTLAKGDR